MAQGKGTYDHLVERIRDETGARAAMVFIIEGKDGNGASMHGSVADHLSMADVLELAATEMRKDAIDLLREEQREAGLPPALDSLIDIMAGIESKAAGNASGENEPLPIEAVIQIGHELIGFLKDKTHFWEEDIYALSAAIGILVAIRKAQNDEENGDPNTGMLRAKEIIASTLNDMVFVATPGESDEIISISKFPH